MALAVAPATQEPNLRGSDATDAEVGDTAPFGLSWVRPAAAVQLVLSAIASLWTLWRYLQVYGSITARPDSAQFGATIVLAVVAAMALSVLVFRPELGELWSLVKTSAAWSIALLLALSVAWWAIANTERQNRWHGALVTSAADTDAYLGGHLAK